MTDVDSTPTAAPITAFCAYSHKDEVLLDELREHLALLQRQGKVSVWHDRKIEAGEEWGKAIDEHLKTSQLVLLLVSSSFINSDYCYNVELATAIDRHNAGTGVVVPIILRACDWHDAPFGAIQALPRDGKPVTTWDNRDEAWLSVVRGIRRVVDRLTQSGDLGNSSSALNESEEEIDPPMASLEREFGDIYDRLVSDWSHEYNVDIYKTDHARGLLTGADAELLRIKLSPMIKARPVLQKPIDNLRVNLSRLARAKPIPNEIRTREFWWSGDEAIERLAALRHMVSGFLHAGLDPADGMAFRTLKADKACLRLATDEEHKVTARFRMNYLLVSLPLRNEGSARARKVRLLSVHSEFGDTKVTPENQVLEIDPDAVGSLSFIFLPSRPADASQWNEARFHLTIGFHDNLGDDTVRYAVHVRDIGSGTFRAAVIRNRTVASPFCPMLCDEFIDDEA